MRPRRWLLALLLSLAVLAAGSLLLWHSMHLEDRLRDTLVQALQEAGMSEVHLGRVRPIAIGLDLHDLEFALPGNNLSLRLERVRLRVSLIHWLMQKRQALGAIQRVELHGPRLQLTLGGGSGMSGASEFGGELDAEAQSSFERLLASLPELYLRNGRIELAGPFVGDTSRLVLDELDGSLAMREGQLYLLLQSRLLEGRRRGLHASMVLQQASLNGEFNLQIDTLGLQAASLAAVPEGVEGELRCGMQINGRITRGSLDSLAGEGWLALDSLQLAPELVLAYRSTLTLDRRGLQIEDGLLNWGAQSLVLQAHSDLFLRNPEVQVEGHGVPLQELLRITGIEADLDADLQLFAELCRDTSGFVSRLRARATDLRVKGERAGTLSVSLRTNEQRVFCDSLLWQKEAYASAIPAGRILLFGELGAPWSSDTVSAFDELSLRGSIRLPETAGAERAELRLRGGITSPAQFLSNIHTTAILDSLRADLQAEYRRDTDLALQFRAHGSRQQTRIELLDHFGHRRGIADVSADDSGSWVWNLELDSLEILDRLPYMDRLPELQERSISLNAHGQGLLAGGDLGLRGGRSDLRLQWTHSREGGRSRVEAKLRQREQLLERLLGEVDFGFLGQRLECERISLFEQLNGSGWVDLQSSSYLIDLECTDLELDRVIQTIAPGRKPAFSLGRLSLLLAGEGQLAHPGLRGGFEYRNRLGEAPFVLRGDIALADTLLEVGRGGLSLAGHDLARLQLRHNPASERGKLSCQLDRTRLEHLYSAVTTGQLNQSTVPETNRNSVFTLLDWLPFLGREEYAASAESATIPLRGNLAGGLDMAWDQLHGLELEFRAEADSLVLAGRDFDRANISMTRDTASAPGVLHLDSLVVTRDSPELTLRVAGDLPYSRRSDLDLDFLLTGDLLKPMTVRSDGSQSELWRKASGPGYISLQMAGSYTEPQIQQGRIRIEEGFAELKYIFRSLEHLNLDLEISNNQLSIHEFSAQVPGGYARISNQPTAVVDGMELEPWVIPGIELDLGVLSWETLNRHMRPGSVELVLPGFMEADWDAKVMLRGQNRGETAYIAGPNEEPHFLGRVEVHSGEFTYPLIKGNKPPDATMRWITSTLETAQWDLDFVVGRNLNYTFTHQGFETLPVFNRLKSMLDRVAVDLTIDPSNDPLRIRGRMLDGDFQILGRMQSTDGTINAIGRQFRIEQAGLEFDASSLLPIAWGRAAYYGVEDTQESIFQPGTQSYDASKMYLELAGRDELGNRITRVRWNEAVLELVDSEGNTASDNLDNERDLLNEFGYGANQLTAEEVIPGMVAGFIDLPLGNVESRLRRELGLDLVKIYVPLVRNAVEGLLVDTRQSQLSQSYLSYLQGSRLVLGKSLGPRYFATWTGQLTTAPSVERDEVNLYQRYSLEYNVNYNLTLTGELVFDPWRHGGAYTGDPRMLLRYRLYY